MNQYQPDAVLCLGDIHLRDTPPRRATETYVEDLLDLLTWTFTYAHQNSIQTIAWAGDVFDHPMPSRTSHALVQRTIAIIQAWTTKDPQRELLIVAGNHDTSNHRIQSILEKQPLGIIARLPQVTLLDGWHPTLPIYGVPWQQQWELTANDSFDRYRSALGLLDGHPTFPTDPRDTLVITHAPLYPPHLVPTEFETLPADSIANAMENTGNVFYGHIHDDHGVWFHEGTVFVNPGALSRGSANESNISRTLHLAVFEPRVSWGNEPDPLQDSPEAPHGQMGDSGLTTPQDGKVGGTKSPRITQDSTDPHHPETRSRQGSAVKKNPVDEPETPSQAMSRWTIVDIPSRPAEEVFHLEAKRAEEDTARSLEHFLSGLSSTTLAVTTVHGVIEHIENLPGITWPVRQKSVALIREADKS